MGVRDVLLLSAVHGSGISIFGLPRRLRITERVKIEFSFDFFNVFNHVNFSTPTLTLNNPAAFGVYTGQAALPNRLDGARGIQAGMRFSF